MGVVREGPVGSVGTRVLIVGGTLRHSGGEGIRPFARRQCLEFPIQSGDELINASAQTSANGRLPFATSTSLCPSIPSTRSHRVQIPSQSR